MGARTLFVPFEGSRQSVELAGEVTDFPGGDVEVECLLAGASDSVTVYSVVFSATPADAAAAG